MQVTLAARVVAVALLFAACGPPRREPVLAPAPRWAALGDACSPDAPATSLPSAARDSLARDDAARSDSDQDARWAEVARVVPGGWGGFFLDHQGRATITLVDTAQRADALAALTRLAVDGRSYGPDVQVRVGRWDFAQLYDWRRYLNQGRLAGVPYRSVDIDEVGNRLVYGLMSAAGVRALEERLTALGVPCFLVAIEILSGMIVPAGPAG